jgi:hypothetical protein
MKASMIVALSLAFAFSGSTLAAAGATHCQTSKDCPPSMHCSIKAHHAAGVCVGAHAKKKSYYY